MTNHLCRHDRGPHVMGRRAVRRAATAAAVVLCSSGASAFVASPGRRDVAALVARAGHQRQIIRRCRQPASGRLRRHRLASSPALAPNDSEGDIQPVDSEISPSSSSSSTSTSTSTSSTSSHSIRSSYPCSDKRQQQQRKTKKEEQQEGEGQRQQRGE